MHDVTGRRLAYNPKEADGRYVRVRVRQADGAFALTQPVFL